jgi:hypothetical protein
MTPSPSPWVKIHGYQEHKTRTAGFILAAGGFIHRQYPHLYEAEFAVILHRFCAVLYALPLEDFQGTPNI